MEDTEMRNITVHAEFPLEIKPRRRAVSKAGSREGKMLFAVLATFGIFGGISALFVGLVFVIIHGVLSGDTIFDKMGTGLLVVAIPMILIGSIFLDKIEEKNV